MNRITKTEFHKLYSLLKTELLNHVKESNSKYELPASDVQIIGGAPGYEFETPSIAKLVEDSVKVKSLLPELAKKGKRTKMSRQHFYKMWRHFQTESKPYSLASPYDRVYFTLFDCPNKDVFRQKFSLPASISKTYTCKYYSIRQLAILEFQLTLTKGDDEIIKASCVGFHDNARTTKLEGEFKIIGNCFYIFMQSGALYLSFHIHGNELNDSAYAGELPDCPFYLGLVSGISSYHFPISFECVLISQELLKVKDEDLWAKRYLFLKRNNTRVKGKDTRDNSIKTLDINTIAVDRVEHIYGSTYKIWAYSSDRNYIIQSILTVHQDGRATLEIPVYRKPSEAPVYYTYNCFITYLRESSNRLSITAYNQLHLKASLIINIPRNQPQFITTGVIVMLDIDNTLTNHLVMKSFKQGKKVEEPGQIQNLKTTDSLITDFIKKEQEDQPNLLSSMIIPVEDVMNENWDTEMLAELKKLVH